MLTNLIMVIISQYKHTSNHHVIHPSLHNIVCQLYYSKVWGESAPKVTKRGIWSECQLCALNTKKLY